MTKKKRGIGGHMNGQKSMPSMHPQLNKVGPDLAHLGQSMYIGMISC